ncbi:DNA-binding IclR family transcriptional regulator [Streptosporangium lutulentum]|uniref:DNA-binding IclR family transcriptional regulator n=1 Tax=Streptosporangium lutulentum TaxID=1461250 RepID=A0ABT9QB91_9ACTN|nr:IclR family transcriptional regulator [Streptosporangium lutulentum]MDP9843989.1 DNA-binding IclR family transcriptional regulator [Streptosporangium lutulentum]
MGETIQSVERAAAILRLLASGSRQLGVAELATAMGLPKGTLHGILRTLVHVGFVEQDRASGKYRLGATLLALGGSYLDLNELRARSLNWADGLAGRSRESVWIGTLHEGQVLVIHHVFRPDNSMQVLQVGAHLPAHATALGKVLLASDPYTDPARPLAACTPRTLTEAAALEAELDLVRTQGWACDLEELEEGEVSIAAPIKDHGVVVGAIGIRGAIERLTADGDPQMELVSYVRDAARAISRDLAR